ncbi:hypothetical protein KIN20_027102 [Parelaphostrongylus tenuis]|uniref:Uncharacterized protein n=1 Tax=Parelaphostrongylus tenuis TaxID=148309 RepID=A0AAD5WDF6_PARTN|nr:hypothetical protein KIN20_027102 [Parelaphostrongylus tenuis]
MAYSTAADVRAQVSSISPNLNSAEALVKRLVIQGVFDVLEQQGRAAGIPDAMIAIILSQLGVNVFYTPLHCSTSLTLIQQQSVDQDSMAMMRTTCVIFGNTVTTICPPATGPAQMKCMPMTGVLLMPIPPQHLSISGTITTSNIVMASWNRVMWQSVVNRVLRMITSGPFGTHFATAVVTVT